MLDLIIQGAEIIDGSGRPAFTGDVGLIGDRIAAVGRLGRHQAHRVIDAAGLILTPGFIDAHGHSDFSLVHHPPAASQVAQGVTTEICGHCGFSAFPLNPRARGLLLDNEVLPADWSCCREYLDRLETQGIGLNVLPLVGHNTLRAAVVGREDRPAATKELQAMKSLLAEALDQGARGFSTGLQYTPGLGADEEEILELVLLAARYGGMYSTHLASYSSQGFQAALDSALRTASLAGVPLSLSHLTVHAAQVKGRAKEVLAQLAQARASGLYVCADIIPHPTLGGWWGPRVIFPEWAYDWKKPWPQEAARLRQLLGDPEARARLRADVLARQAGEHESIWGQFFRLQDWGTIFLFETRVDSPMAVYAGLPIREIAHVQAKDPVEVYFDLVLSEGPELSTVNIAWEEQDHCLMAQDPGVMFGSDVVAVSIELALAPFSTLQVAPRTFGHTVYVLETMVGKKGWLSWPEAIRKMTGLPAAHYHIPDRGLIRPGFKADLALFSREELAEKGTWTDPAHYPAGFRYVWVNGTAAMEEGRLTGRLGGRVLRRRP
ncbi:MAG: amidohydrolase family protein [Thermodesulfobacteriota bacterium]